MIETSKKFSVEFAPEDTMLYWACVLKTSVAEIERIKQTILANEKSRMIYQTTSPGYLKIIKEGVVPTE